MKRYIKAAKFKSSWYERYDYTNIDAVIAELEKKLESTEITSGIDRTTITLTDDELDSVLETIYSGLSEYTAQLNTWCKKLKVYKEYGEYRFEFCPKMQLPKLREVSIRSKWELALPVLIAKSKLEIPEYSDEYKNEIYKSSIKNKVTPYKLLVTLIKNKFGLSPKTIIGYTGSYYIDEIPGGLPAFDSFLDEIYDKYDLPSKRYKRDWAYHKHTEGWEDIDGRYQRVPLSRPFVSLWASGYHKLYFVYDPEIKDYVILEDLE